MKLICDKCGSVNNFTFIDGNKIQCNDCNFVKNTIENNNEYIKELELLQQAITLDDLNSIILHSEMILKNSSKDYVSNYYLAYAKSKQGNVKYLTDFLDRNDFVYTQKELEIVCSHINKYSDLRYKKNITTFLNKLSNSTLVENYSKSYNERKKLEENYSIFEREIFICHSSTDRSLVEKVIEGLKKDSYYTWVSFINLRPTCTNYWDEIEEAMENCKVVLVISSIDSMLSKDVQKEILLSKKMNKLLVEFKIDTEEHNIPFKRMFDGLQWVDGYTNFNDGLITLRNKLFTMLNKEDDLVSKEVKPVSKEIKPVNKEVKPVSKEIKPVSKEVKPVKKEVELSKGASIDTMDTIIDDLNKIVLNDITCIVEFSKTKSGVLKGSEISMYNIGLMYKNAKGVKRDYKEAMKWFLRGAQKDHLASIFSVAILYDEGLGVEIDYKEAMKWYLRAAEKNHKSAIYNVGIYYKKGQGVKQDYKEAMKWYLKGAEMGHIASNFSIGILYDEGLGVKKDCKEAMKWYLRAAEKGHASSCYNVGLYYKKGQGVKQDYKETMKWHLKAAENGHVASKYSIGLLYENGFGVEKDNKLAIDWFKKAAKENHKEAINKLKKLGI